MPWSKPERGSKTNQTDSDFFSIAGKHFAMGNTLIKEKGIEKENT
jgi:hypothetical protein